MAPATDDLLRHGDSRTFIHHDHLDAVPELSTEVSRESRASAGHHVRPEIEGENGKIGIHQTNLDHPVSILQKPGITPHRSSSKDAKEETPPLDASLGRKGGCVGSHRPSFRDFNLSTDSHVVFPILVLTCH